MLIKTEKKKRRAVLQENEFHQVEEFLELSKQNLKIIWEDRSCPQNI